MSFITEVYHWQTMEILLAITLTKSMPNIVNPIKKIISKPMIFTCLVHLDIALLSKKQTFPTIFYEQPKKSGRRPTYHKISEFTMRFNDPRQC